MKITDTQYIIVRHQDREHPHVHIVFNRIDNNGKTISDKNDMYRNEQVCKKLKARHGLYFAKGKEQVKPPPHPPPTPPPPPPPPTHTVLNTRIKQNTRFTRL